MTVPAESEQDHLSPPMRRRCRVLVVEDDDDLRGAIREAFLMKGFLVNTAADGFDAIELALREAYDVIVTDHRLPGMTGTGIARICRTLATPPKVILITAYPDWKVKQEADAAGVVEVLHKPFNLFKLASAVEGASGRITSTSDPALN